MRQITYRSESRLTANQAKHRKGEDHPHSQGDRDFK
jgi:hypothetical protein